MGTGGEHDALDVVVVGAGFAGMYMLHRARRAGLRVHVVEAGSGVGGTWYWNRYPGARCDVESMEYSYGFDTELERDWEWSERYATQPEILRYAEHVADRFDLRRDITFDTRVVSATFDETACTWSLVTDADDALDRRFTGRFVVMATGCLSVPHVPALPGIERFAGRLLHTGAWPHEPVDFTGERVAVIGTGSSGIQSIPVIAEHAAELIVFQRTPNYAVPAHNRPLDPAETAAFKAEAAARRAANRTMPAAFGASYPNNPEPAAAFDTERRTALLDERWEHGGLAFLAAFRDTMLDASANRVVADYVRSRIESIVHDPEVAATLSPSSPIGCKRLCVDTGYYDTFNRPGVRLVDLSTDPIESFTPDAIVAGTTTYAVDSIVLATGFDAMTGALSRIEIVGRGGVRLADAWAAGPQTYLGLQIAGFPNLFTVTGPASPSVLTNMLVSIEHHVEWIDAAIAECDRRRARTIEATDDAQRDWGRLTDGIADFTLFPSCNSWYLGANVDGKPRRFMAFVGFPMYATQLAEITDDGYRGFAFA